MDFNYKIIFAILLSLILGYVIYIYFFRKPVTMGEKLKDVQSQQLSLQHELLHAKPPPVIKASIEVENNVNNDIPPSVEDMDDDNLTRESLYEEILKLNVLKNPVDFLFKFDINDLFTGGKLNNKMKAHYLSEELDEGLETVEGGLDYVEPEHGLDHVEPEHSLDQYVETVHGLDHVEPVHSLEVEPVHNLITNLNGDYPQDTEAFGKINREEQEEELSKKIFSDMINMDKEEKELTVPKKKKIVIKKK